MRAVVLDASVAVSWLLPDEETKYLALRNDEEVTFYVPLHWQAEVCNSLIQVKKRERLSNVEFEKSLTILNNLSKQALIPSFASILSDIARLALAYGLTSYDAAYLQVAQKGKLPFATLDKALITAAKKLSIEVLKT